MEKYNALIWSKGLPLSQINPGSKEFALTRDLAIQAIDALAGTAVAVLGGDVLNIVCGKLRYSYDNWFFDEEKISDKMMYAKNSRDKARSFIKEYKQIGDFEPLFVLVVEDAAD